LALSSLIFEKTFKSEPVPDMTPEPENTASGSVPENFVGKVSQ
jgi:hypothetical protein